MLYTLEIFVFRSFAWNMMPQNHFRRMLNLETSSRSLSSSTEPCGIKIEATPTLIKSNCFLTFKPDLNQEALKINACTLVASSTITGNHSQLSKETNEKISMIQCFDTAKWKNKYAISIYKYKFSEFSWYLSFVEFTVFIWY